MRPKSWKTSMFGTLALAAALVGIVRPEMKERMDKATELLLGVGLWTAADHIREPSEKTRRK
jgi:hypothetical protein